MRLASSPRPHAANGLAVIAWLRAHVIAPDEAR